MKKLILIFLFIFTNFLYGQKFDIMDFNKKFEVAEWLYEYDMVAWETSDSVMAQGAKEIERLGSEWFCYKENNIWHAIYGKYENNQYDLVFHFIVDYDGSVSRTNEPVDATVLVRYSKALQTANKQLIEIKETVNIRFNQYIKENSDNTFTVWILPAFQTNGVAVYGGEFIYTIDSGGTQILKDESYYQGEFRGFNVDNPREIWLDYSDVEKPTLGGVFFAWYYKEYFTKIVINTSESISTPFKGSDGWTWISTEKD